MCAQLPEENLVDPPATASGRDLRLKRILAPTDFSENAEHALNYAIGLSRPYHAEIEVLHVFHLREYLAPLSGLPEIDTKTANEVLEAAEARAAKKLDEVVHSLRDEQAVLLPILLIGVPFEEIVRYAAEREVDLIVMASHGRTGLAHFLLGSTAERVISHARCPVVVVKDRNEKPIEEKAS